MKLNPNPTIPEEGNLNGHWPIWKGTRDWLAEQVATKSAALERANSAYAARCTGLARAFESAVQVVRGDHP